MTAIRDMCQIIENMFLAAYYPGENATIDKQLVGFRGRFRGFTCLINQTSPGHGGLQMRL